MGSDMTYSVIEVPEPEVIPEVMPRVGWKDSLFRESTRIIREENDYNKNFESITHQMVGRYLKYY